MLWSSDAGRCVALCLLSSIPSGDHEIVNIRSEILGNLVGPGWCYKSLLIPTIDHPTDVTKSSLYGARVIYVGHPVSLLQCTPWVSPCSMVALRSPKGGDLDFQTYCSMRADSDEWLVPLLGCHLICDCSLPAHSCHARHIQNLCVDLVKRIKCTSNEEHVCDHQADQWEHQDHDDSHDEVDHADRITALDETLTGEKVPNHVGWPDSWTQFGL